MKIKTFLNSEILKLTTMIDEKYPELSKYVEEFKITIPTDKNPEISVKNLSTYYESLNLLLNNYMRDHPSESTKPKV